jgi:NADP-dependent 3-hydroxy acid dehydrogenase YdfG
MCESIYNRISELSSQIANPQFFQELTHLTHELISVYDKQHRLDHHPFASARLRTIDVPMDVVKSRLEGKVCIVTGGAGCVGSSLIESLLKINVGLIISLDLKSNTQYHFPDARVVRLQCDIRDASLLKYIFNVYKPEYIFHTAAQRDPGYAETHIAETITTNILGTLNVVKACENSESVKQCVFTSSGKASRYYTEEIYAASKKLCEYILDRYARSSRVSYSVIRFTHILDNSLMNWQIEKSCNTDNYVKIHSPGKYVTAQNVNEACSLLLNSIVYASHGKCNLLLVRNLEWPTESLELALYHIKKSGRNVPIIFSGNPAGYTEKLFRGQMDWSDPIGLNLLINVYEFRRRKEHHIKDMIISETCACSEQKVDDAISQLTSARGEEESKKCLLDVLDELMRTTLMFVDPKETVEILSWGLEEKDAIRLHQKTISLLYDSLKGTGYEADIEATYHPVHTSNYTTV